MILSSERAQGGFTLLEVMIAVAILAIALGTLLGAQSQSVSIAMASRQSVNAALLARHRLALLELVPFDDLGNDSGDFGEDFPGWQWSLEVEEVSAEDLGLEKAEGLLKRLTLTVRREGAGGGATVRLLRMANQVKPQGRP